MQSDGPLTSVRTNTTARVLFVVEHDEVVRSALTFILRDAYETHAYASLDQLGAGVAAHDPDLILLGEGLAMASATQDLADLKAADLAATKLLLLQNRIGGPAHAGHCRPFGRNADGILRKPITVDNVRDTVAALLGEGRA